MERTSLEEVLDFLSDLNLRMTVEDFMQKILDAAIMLVPGFNKGSVIFKDEKGRWRYVAIRGYPEFVKEMDLTKKGVFIPLEGEPVVVRNIFEHGKDRVSEDVLKAYEKAGTPQIKVTIAVTIFAEGQPRGAIFLDSLEDIQPSEEDLKVVKAFSRIASIFITMKIFQERERRYQKAIIGAMVKAMEARDPYTVGHSERVAMYAVAIAKKLGLDMRTIDRIYWGSIVHDIGKLAVPERILLKPGKLSAEEFEVIKRHPIAGEELIKDYEWLQDIRKIVRNHHERWDGKGYPDGLKGEEIPLEVRIVTIADAFDAMTSKRAYRESMSVEEALTEIKRQAGKQFDPNLVDIAIEALREEHERVAVG